MRCEMRGGGEGCATVVAARLTQSQSQLLLSMCVAVLCCAALVVTGPTVEVRCPRCFLLCWSLERSSAERSGGQAIWATWWPCQCECECECKCGREHACARVEVTIEADGAREIQI